MLYVIFTILLICYLIFNKKDGLLEGIRIKKKCGNKYRISYGSFIEAFILNEFIFFILSFIICTIVTLFIPATEERYSFNINSLEDNVVTQGKFYCHRGYVDGELSYFFSRTMNKGEAIGHIPASDSYIRYDDTKHPQIEVVKQMAVVPDIINYWMPMFEATKIMFNEDCEKEYIITVPSGTISNDGTYNIDME